MFRFPFRFRFEPGDDILTDQLIFTHGQEYPAILGVR